MINKRKGPKIGAAIMVRDMAPFIGAVIRSLDWVDGIFLYDDHSSDGTALIAKRSSKTEIFIETSKDSRSAFQRGQSRVRNSVIRMAFSKLNCDVLVLVDGDELMSEHLRTVIDFFWSRKSDFDNISLSIWHLFTETEYIHFWDTAYKNSYLIDPHIRVIKKGQRFEDILADGNHPGIKGKERTLFVHGSYHFHLKYFHKSPFPNYAIDFLPRRLSRRNTTLYLKKLPFILPKNIERCLRMVRWKSLPKMNSDYYKAYKEKICKLNPEEAIKHPRDRIRKNEIRKR
ncbi:MAG: hypothetical protein R2772_11060 [Chitinophagales bacterium]